MSASRTVLVTGASGFVGSHLLQYLADERPADRVVPVSRADFDLHSPDAWDDLLARERPHWLIHLAGQASPALSFRDPEATWRANLMLPLTVFRAVERSKLKLRVLLASTGLIYGTEPPAGIYREETDAPNPASPYAASKAAADLLAEQMGRAGALDVVRIRPFTQIGPGQSPQYAAAAFARQIARIRLGLQEPMLRTGDLSGERDLLDVRDAVRAYIMVLESAPPGGVYHVARGGTVTMREVVEAMVGFAGRPVEVVELPDPARAGEARQATPSIERLRDLTGWRPMIELGQTLADMVDRAGRDESRGNML